MAGEYSKRSISKGLAIYRKPDYQFYYVRIWNNKTKKYVVRSTGEKSIIRAEEVAKEFYQTLLETDLQKTDPNRAFKRFAKLLDDDQARRVREGSLAKDTQYNDHLRLFGNNRIVDLIGDVDVADISLVEVRNCVEKITGDAGAISASSRNQYYIAIRKVLKIAVEYRILDALPLLPTLERSLASSKPRPAFRFHPVVSKQRDEYQKVLDTAKSLIGEKIKMLDDHQTRYVTFDEEFYDLIIFLTHSFVRPSNTELFAITHSDVEAKTHPKRLQLRIKGKTGHRYVDTMPAAASVYERIVKRYPDHELGDHIFYPNYKTRDTAQRIAQRAFNYVLQISQLKHDPDTNDPRSLYSLRHTAIQMRLVNSKGRINIYQLAKNCGTSVEMIEKFYARLLPNTDEVVRNLQSFGIE